MVVVEDQKSLDQSAAACPRCTSPAAIQATLASAVGNRAMNRLAQRVAAAQAAGDRRSPEAIVVSDALQLARGRYAVAAPLLARTLSAVEQRPSTIGPVPAEAGVCRTLARCGCGSHALPGGDCAECAEDRLTRQGMPALEAQRIVAARQQLSRQPRVLARRSFRGCVNANLSNAGIAGWTIALLGGVCAVLGAIAGLVVAAPTGETAAPATVPSGMAIAAATCVAFVTGLSFGFVLGIIKGCISDPDHYEPAVNSSAMLDPPGGDDAAAATV